jgi:glutathione S-transferase
MSESYQLYYFASCPYCIKARVQLWQLGIELPLKNIKRKPEFKRELIAGGGKKQVPCLRIEENENVSWLYESKDIVDYFKKKTQV